MKMMLENIASKMAQNPNRLFLIDSLGAVISALSLGVVLVQLESLLGMPRDILYYLAAAAVVFAFYSFACYWRVKENWRPFLKFIAIANFVYCLISIVLVCQHYSELTILALLYFLSEFAIILTLVAIEWKTAIYKP
jgi:hypothetical protein